MGEIVIAVGSKENFDQDVRLLAGRWSASPRITAVTGPAVREAVVERASALFVDGDTVLVLLDPSEEVMRRIEAPLAVVKERTGVIVYFTSADATLPASLEATRVNLEQEREKRFKERVLAAVKTDGKKMTDKAFELLRERIGDEALLEVELAKLIDYAGERELIGVKDVAAVVTEAHEEDFIALSEAIARRDKKAMLAILEALLSQGMDVLALHGFLARRIRLLLQARDGEGDLSGEKDFRLFSKAFGRLKEALDPGPMEKRNYLAFQKPYYAYNLSKASRKYAKADLVSLFDMLARFDGRVKSGTKHGRTRLEAGLLGV